MSLLVLSSSSRLAAAGEAKGLVFEGVTVLDGTGKTLAGATVAVRDGKIALGGAGDRRIDGKGLFLTPGLVDAASRAGYARAAAEHTRELTPDVDARDLADPWSESFRDAARAGCTTVSLSPGAENVVAGIARAFRTATSAGDAAPLEGAAQPLWLTLTSDPSAGNTTARFGPTQSIYARRPNNRMGVVWMLRQAFLDARSADGAASAPYREALDGRRACRVLAHRWQDMSAMLRIADETGLRDVVFAGAEEAYLGRTELARRKAAVIVGPAPSETRGEGADHSDTALANAAMLHAAGVRVALTAGPLGGSRLREQAMAAVRWGMPKDAALAAITSVAADLAGVPGRGRVTDGGPADLVLWSGHPLLPSSRALLVLIDGEVVHDGRETAR